MQSVLADWTMVIAGAWNASIFSPAWVSANVFGGENVNLEMQLGPISPSIRFHHGRMTLIIQPDMIVGAARESTPDAMTEITGALISILNMLPHTPISAFGLNFGFREDHPNDALIANFDIVDSKKLIDFGGEVSQTSIQREVMLDGALLRLRETIEPTGAVHFHLNFHYDVTDAAEAARFLEEKGAQKRARALDLIRTIYGLEPE